MKKKNKKKEKLDLCFKYATNCKFCPRNRKCDEEIDNTQRTNKSKVRRKTNVRK